MVGAAAAVLSYATTELGERHQPHPAIVSGGLQSLEEAGDGIRQVGEQPAVDRALAGVSVEALEADVKQARSEAPRYQSSDQLELLREAIAE